jgi:hypothetical protein
MTRFTSLLPSLATTMLKKVNRDLDEILIRDRMNSLGLDRASAEIMVETEVKQELANLTEDSIHALRIH